MSFGRKRGSRYGRRGEWVATHRRVPMSCRKARLVLDQIRGKQVEVAQQVLRFSKKRAAYYVDRVLRSAIANATAEATVDPDMLYVAEVWADHGSLRGRKRWKAGPHGRVRPILRRQSHISVVLRTAGRLE